MMPRSAVALLAIALGACHAAQPSPASPALVGATPAAPAVRVVALISASVEWKAVVAQLSGDALHDTPFGQWLVHRFGAEDVVVFHGGYGKVSAAGSTQYAIDRWHPALLVNLGTCGGFGGERKVGDVVLATDTLIYDIFERMGSAAEAIEDYHTRLEPARWPARLADRVVRSRLISADGDLDPAAVATLHTTYHTGVADWESGAIAWVAAHNQTPLIILRGVTDLVDAAGDPTYNAEAAWEPVCAEMMASLIRLFADALPDLR